MKSISKITYRKVPSCELVYYALTDQRLKVMSVLRKTEKS